MTLQQIWQSITNGLYGVWTMDLRPILGIALICLLTGGFWMLITAVPFRSERVGGWLQGRQWRSNIFLVVTFLLTLAFLALAIQIAAVLGLSKR